MHLELVRFHKVWWKWLKIGYTGKLKLAKISANNEMQLCLEQTQEKPWCSPTGPVAQWITRLTTDQKIPGSNPGRFDSFWMLWSVFGLLALQWIDLMPKTWRTGMILHLMVPSVLGSNPALDRWIWLFGGQMCRSRSGNEHCCVPVLCGG